MHKSTKWVMYPLFMMIALSSCLEHEESEYDKVQRADEERIQVYLNNNNLEATRLDRGLFYTPLKENSSGKKVAIGDILTIKYKMSTLDGQVIDSTSVTSEGKPLRFQHVGGGLLPTGINIGVDVMREGETYRFYLPSIYGYYNYSYKDILPANAILVADVEIVKIESEKDIKAQDKALLQQYISEHALESVTAHDSGLYIQTIKAGSGAFPIYRQSVKVNYKGMFLNDSIFNQTKKDEPLTFMLGVNDIIPGFQQGISMMKKGEIARVMLPSLLAYKSGIQILPEVIRTDFIKESANGIRDWKPYEPIVFEIELLDIQ